jgi:hypothetical protein
MNGDARYGIGADMQTRLNGVNYAHGTPLANAVLNLSPFGEELKTFTSIRGTENYLIYDKLKRYLYITNTVTLLITAVVLVGFVIISTLGALNNTPKPHVSVPLGGMYVDTTNKNVVLDLGAYVVWPIVFTELLLSVILQILFYWRPASMRFSTKINKLKSWISKMAQKRQKMGPYYRNPPPPGYIAKASDLLESRETGDEINFIEILFFSVDTIQWIVNLVAVPLVLWVTSALAGVGDVYTLAASVVIGIWFVITVGILHEHAHTNMFSRILGTQEKKVIEETNEVYSDTTWSFYLLGILPFVCYWIIVVTHLVVRFQNEQNLLPFAYIIAWIVGIFLLTVAFDVAVLIHYASSAKLMHDETSRAAQGASRAEVVQEIMWMNFVYSLAKQIIFTLIKIAPAIFLIVNLYV